MKDIKRQEDDAFQHILSTVRMGNTTPQNDTLLKSRLLSTTDISQVDIEHPGAAHICSLRQERDAWNSLFLGKVHNDLYTFEAEDTDITGNPLPEKDKRCTKWFHRERLEDTLDLKVGARVVLCKNIDTDNGWLNGTLATVRHIRNTCITIQSIRTGKTTVVRRMRQNLTFPGSPTHFVRTQFPIILGWALTVHKVQGMTLNTAYIQLNKNFFASGQAYVALSRVKCIDNLHLLDYDPTAIYLDSYYKDLLKWMKHVDKIQTSPNHMPTKMPPFTIQQNLQISTKSHHENIYALLTQSRHHHKLQVHCNQQNPSLVTLKIKTIHNHLYTSNP